MKNTYDKLIAHIQYTCTIKCENKYSTKNISISLSFFPFTILQTFKNTLNTILIYNIIYLHAMLFEYIKMAFKIFSLAFYTLIMNIFFQYYIKYKYPIELLIIR